MSKTQEISGNANMQAGRDLTVQLPPQPRVASLIGEIVPVIANAIGTSPSSTKPFEIEEKLTHNNVCRYRHWVEEYALYGATVERILEEIDDQKAGTKRRTLHYFRERYITIVAQRLPEGRCRDISFVRKHADDIIDEIVEETKVAVAKSSGANQLFLEDLGTVVTALTCYAFLVCKILEPPL